jgi:hypothetical protein
MQELKTIKSIQRDKYNEEPVFYCKHCLSLNIRGVEEMNLDYCDDCGSTDIEECQIEEWRDKYRNKFGHDYLDKY